MTGEQFHDALTLLPADLIAQAEEYRCRKPKVIPLKRYAAAAACLAVLLCAAKLFRDTQQEPAKTEMAAASYSVLEDAGVTDEAPRMEAAKEAPAAGSAATEDNGISFVCVETPVNVHTTASFVHGPSATGITSREELDDYLSKWDRLYLLDALRDACEIYEEAWFASHDLLLIPVDCVSGPCTVTDTEISDGICQVIIHIGSEKAEEPTNYHILLPIEKNAITAPENITIIYNSDTTD